MSSREEFFENWATGTEAAPSQVEPEPEPMGPLFDAPDRATKQQPSLPQKERRRPRPQPRRRLAPTRRVKRTVKRVDPIGILKLSLFFYSIFLIVWLVVVAIGYGVVSSLGLFETIEKFGKGFVLFDEVNITLGFVEKWALLIGITMVVIGSIVNLILATLYNIAADIIGGVEVTFVERD